MSDNIEEQVMRIVAENLDVKPESVKMESSFAEDLGADSLDIVELVMELEQAFDMRIPDESQENITTVQQVVDFIRETQSGS